MIYLYSSPLSSDNQTAFADFAVGEAVLISSTDLIAGWAVFKDPDGVLLLPDTYPWQSQILILTIKVFPAEVIIRKDIAPKPEVSKRQIKSQLNIIGHITCSAAVSMWLVTEALGYFSGCPSAEMATCPLVLFLNSGHGCQAMTDTCRPIQVLEHFCLCFLVATTFVRHDTRLLNAICWTAWCFWNGIVGRLLPGRQASPHVKLGVSKYPRYLIFICQNSFNRQTSTC